MSLQMLSSDALAARVAHLPWNRLTQQLDDQGFAILKALLTPKECDRLVAFYPQTPRFRKRVVMEQHRFGRGEYQYFAYPLPEIVQTLRESLYSPLAPLANRWHWALQGTAPFPPSLGEFIATCHRSGQTRPTPLLLKYQPGDFNCLHQDLYGDRRFPFQIVILLNEPGQDFTGGELVLTQQKARAQAQVQVLTPGRGDGVVFAVNCRPVPGPRGICRVTMKHGVSLLHRGERHCLGIVFHDAT